MLEHKTNHKTILGKISELRTLSTPELLEKWRHLYDSEAPAISKPLLVRKLCYRIQELEYGSFSDKTKKLLKEHTEAYEKGKILRKKNMNVGKPVNGTRLTRIFNGEEHQVMVAPDGYEYKGQTYKSLSIIARKITGTRWSGPLFFGLKNKTGAA